MANCKVIIQFVAIVGAVCCATSAPIACRLARGQELAPVYVSALQPLVEDAQAVAPASTLFDSSPMNDSSPAAAWLTEASSANDDVEAMDLVPRLVGSVVVVAATCLVALFFVKRFGWHRLGKIGRAAKQQIGTSIRLVASLPLDARNSLKLVDVDGQRYVIGIDPNGIKSMISLHSFSDAIDSLQEAGRRSENIVSGTLSAEAISETAVRMESEGPELTDDRLAKATRTGSKHFWFWKR